MSEKLVTKESLTEVYPEIISEIRKEAHEKGFSEGETKAKEIMSQEIEKAKSEGAQKERDRIKSVKEQLIPGHEALIETLMFDGKTTGEQAAIKVLSAERSLRENKLKTFREEGQDIKVPVSQAIEKPADAVDPNLPVEERAKAEWDKDPGLRAEFGNNFNSYLAFKKADEAGVVKIHGRRN